MAVSAIDRRFIITDPTKRNSVNASVLYYNETKTIKEAIDETKKCLIERVSFEKTMVSGYHYAVVTATSSITLHLPSSPNTGDWVRVVDLSGNAGTNNITIGRNGKTIMDEDDDYIIDVAYGSVKFVYDGTTWVVF